MRKRERIGRTLAAAIVTAAVFAGPASAKDPAKPDPARKGGVPIAAIDGKQLFARFNCAECHAEGIEGHLGTAALAWRGREEPVLTKRTDLTRDYVRYAVRNGIESMPGFRPTEMSDAELDALAAFLARE